MEFTKDTKINENFNQKILTIIISNELCAISNLVQIGHSNDFKMKIAVDYRLYRRCAQLKTYDKN